jgi:hypothetical protein
LADKSTYRTSGFSPVVNECKIADALIEIGLVSICRHSGSYPQFRANQLLPPRRNFPVKPLTPMENAKPLTNTGDFSPKKLA